MKTTIEFDNYQQMLTWARDLLGVPHQPPPSPEYESVVLADDPIEVLALPNRAAHALKTAELHTVGRVMELLAYDDQEFLKIPNFGRRALRGLKEAITLYKPSVGTGPASAP